MPRAIRHGSRLHAAGASSHGGPRPRAEGAGAGPRRAAATGAGRAGSGSGRTGADRHGMSGLSFFAILVTLAAGFGLVNYRLLRVHVSTGVLIVALAVSVLAIAVDP